MSKRAGGSRSVGAESALSNRLSEPAEPPAKKAKAYVEKGATAAANENGKGKEVWDGTRLLYFLGPQGTYSHQVARTLLPLMQRRKDGSQVKLMPVDTIVNTTKRAARRTQTTGEISYALLPFENNINGPVHESYDILYNLSNLDDVGFSVVEESYLPVSHCLMCTKQTYAELTKESPGEPQLDRIQVVSSHWQALGQCSKFIESSLNNPELKKTQSTGEAASELQEYHKNGQHLAACISSKVCAEPDVYDLVILEEGVQNSTENTTRFLLLECAENVKEGLRPPHATEFEEAARISTARLEATLDVECYCWRMLLRVNATTTLKSLDNIVRLIEVHTGREQKSHIRSVDRRHLRDMSQEIASSMIVLAQHEIMERRYQGEWPWAYLVEIQMRNREEEYDGNDVLSDRINPEWVGLPPHVRLSGIFDSLREDIDGQTIMNRATCLGIWPVRMDRLVNDDVS